MTGLLTCPGLGLVAVQGDNFAEYQREFERNYYGNRAPLGIFSHAGLLMAFSEHQDQLNRFLEWALTHEDVWLVTTYEVSVAVAAFA